MVNSVLPDEVQALLPILDIDIDDITRVAPMDGGLSGGRLYRLWLGSPNGPSGECARVIKYSEPLEGWLGITSGDTLLREAQLASSGILDDLPHGMTLATLSVAFVGSQAAPNGAALLMRDERPYLLPRPYRTPPGTIPREALAILERLAQMHARYWNDPRLDNPRLGLMSPECALRVTGPEGVMARLGTGDTLPYLSLAAEGWRAFFEMAGDEAARRFHTILAEPGRILQAINQLPRTLVHGDVWGPNLGWLPTIHGRRRLLLLDWALAMAGPSTYDLLWLCSAWLSVAPTRALAVYRARLTRALRARGYHLDGATWLALADAGYLRTVLTCGEALARTARYAPSGVARQEALARVAWWVRRALQAADRLERLT